MKIKVVFFVLFFYSSMMNAQNDLCSNAVNLIPSITCTSTSGTFNNAQLDGNTSTCASNASQDVWYKFTATDPTMYVEVSNSINIGLDVAIEIYSGDCNGTLITCKNEATATQGYESYFNTNFVVGQTYYIRVLNVSSTISTRNFSICVQKYPTPANDLCANATTLTPGISCSTIGGTFSGTYFDGNVSTCASNASQDVWYKFTATDPTMYVEVSNSINIGLDIAMEIYSGDCNGTLVACQNNTTATQGYESYFNTNFVVGQTYYVRVLNVSSTISTRNFSICVQKYPTPANDLCANATTLTPGISCSTIGGTFSGAYFDGNVSTCASNASQDVWYKFTATDPTMYVEVSNSINIGLDIAMEIYSGDCNGTLVTCKNEATATQGYESYFNTNFVVGQTYYVRVLNVSSTISTRNFSICVQKYPTPANDLCANATTLTPGISCSTIGGTFSGAYFDGNVSTCASNASQDVWYKFTATDPTMYVEVSNSINIGLDVAIEIYSGDCNGTLVTCKNEATATQGYESYFNTNFVVGQIYYIRVLNVSSTISTRNFSICVQKYPTPANDLCANATTLTPGISCSTIGGTFSGAYFDGNVSTCASNASQDVWYKFTATDPTMYVEVSNSINIGLDVAIEIYSGDCNGTLITCKNEATATQGYESYFNNNFVVGQIYYVRVLNVSSTISIRNFSICVQKYPTPANDLCENATILTHSTNCVTTSGTFAGSSITTAAPSCASDSSQDVWYKFVANNTGLNISISNSINIGLDLGMEIMSTDCSGTPTACVNQGGTTSGGEFYSSSNFVVGNTYYVRVFNVSPNLSVRSFSICVQGAVLDTNSFERNNITIVPNPVKDVFKISNLDSVTNYSYQIVNIQGQLIDHGKLSQDSINTANLNQGVYILRLSDGTKEMTTKFIKE